MQFHRCAPLDLAHVAYTDLVPPYVYLHLYLGGRLDVDRLTDAVERAAAVVPESLCRFDARSVGFREAGFTGVDALAEQSELSVGPEWDLEAGPQVKLLVGHGSAEDCLVIGISHILADAAGLRQYARLVSDIYCGQRVTTVNHRAVEPCLAGRPVGPATMAERRNLGTTVPIPPVLPVPPAEAGRHCRTVTLPAPTVAALREVARARGATLNDVFLAAYARALARTLPAETVRIGCPADLRRDSSGGLSIANLSGLYKVTVTVNPDDGFADTVDVVNAEMTVLRAANRHLAGVSELLAACRRTPRAWVVRGLRRRAAPRPIAYSNLGVIPAGLRFGDCPVTGGFLTQAYRHAGEFQLGISTFNGETPTTTLSCAVTGPVAVADVREHVLREVAGECAAWAAADAHPFASGHPLG
ncbi:MAG: hypothetical protein LBI33_06975 [Propionibacteriaceae bacterium]|jgi:NRPS condensation-like uncharacterized protein|nr:hypothetical protein [Propionibacteriaceae bacterium]